MKFGRLDLKNLLLMLIFAGLVVGGLQIAGMWVWVMSSGAIPAYEGGVHVMIALIGALFAINGLLKILATLKTKFA
ncbi:hypothetical protein [Geoglobus ahangari]